MAFLPLRQLRRATLAQDNGNAAHNRPLLCFSVQEVCLRLWGRTWTFRKNTIRRATPKSRAAAHIPTGWRNKGQHKGQQS
jgi:hypothetical protein